MKRRGSQQRDCRRAHVRDGTHLYFWMEVPIAPSMYAMRDWNSASSCPNTGDRCSGSTHAL